MFLRQLLPKHKNKARFTIMGEEVKLVLFETLKANVLFDQPKTYVFDIVRNSDQIPVGRIDLRLGMSESLYYYGNIGYSIYHNYRGHHYALQACRLILEVAKKEKMEKVILTCNPDNIASFKTIQEIPARYIDVKDVPDKHPIYRAGERQKCIFEVDLNEKSSG